MQINGLSEVHSLKVQNVQVKTKQTCYKCPEICGLQSFLRS